MNRTLSLKVEVIYKTTCNLVMMGDKEEFRQKIDAEREKIQEKLLPSGLEKRRKDHLPYLAKVLEALGRKNPDLAMIYGLSELNLESEIS